MNQFYIYIHYRESDGTPFYIGKGSGDRSTQTKNRNPYWKRT